MAEFDLKGMRQAIDRMKALPNTVRKKVVMGALRKSAVLVAGAAKVNALQHLGRPKAFCDLLKFNVCHYERFPFPV